ncbi:hypothetical protein TSUD_372880 [Trifolium subterraneum]|uniref:Replication factor A C-terminal domain-containing protein n=1 Tax=Trifolium subterraneum TaxID=3900 RepID=A0A2Z6PLJ2_TRISU|nr:hypothetical protein TSUD_372880 [Trifolium subterraneum]
MVLMDNDGGRIHATIKKTLIYKFKNDLIEGKVYCFENLGVSTNGGAYRTTHHPYKMNFQYTSVVQRLSNFEINISPFDFVPISDIVTGVYDTDFLCDVIGVLTGFGQEREITNQNGTATKLNVIILEQNGHKIQCTLFGPYVDELNAFLGAGDCNNATVIMQLAKAKSFQDKIHIQNCLNCSVLIFNSTCAESVALRSRILNPDSFWYTACVCGKDVIPDSRMFYCEKCNKHVSKVLPRFCIKVRVMDHTDSATFVIFDNNAATLFDMSCADMIHEMKITGGVGAMPPQLHSLIDNTWLFKVEAKANQNQRFEQSFRVKKICTDAAIITQFQLKWDKEEAAFSKSTNEIGSLSTLVDKAKGVLVEGSSHVLSEDFDKSPGSSFKGKEVFENAAGSSIKGKKIIVEGTPDEVSQDLMNKFSLAAVNLGDNSDVCFEETPTKFVEKQAVSIKEKPTNGVENKVVSVKEKSNYVVEKQYVSVKEKTKTVGEKEVVSMKEKPRTVVDKQPESVKAIPKIVVSEISASVEKDAISANIINLEGSDNGRPNIIRRKSVVKRNISFECKGG